MNQSNDQIECNDDRKSLTSSKKKHLEVFKADFVVIGTGAAGSVLANVLSSNKNNSVICVEAGQNADHDPLIVAPSPGIDPNLYGPQYFWPGNTLPDPNAGNLTQPWTNGRVLGGGTSIYGMLATRGSFERFDEWTPLVGPDWTGQKVYDAYKEMEKFNGTISDPENHGYSGPQVVRLGIPDSNTTPQWLEAFESTNAIGMTVIDDYNSPQTPIGIVKNFQYFQFPDQTRGSASRSFLNSNVMDVNGFGVNGRKLRVLTKTTATHLLWSKKKKNTVKGVYAVMDGVPILIKAKKRVIISAGLKSSAFLQVNGIGPKDVLEAAGVTVRVVSPNVGTGLKNGYYVFTGATPPSSFTPNTEPGTFYQIGAFLPDQRPGKSPTLRNIELTATLRNYPQFGGNIQLFIVETPLRPKSSGTIKITSSDPLKLENVDIGFLNDPDDLDETIYTFNSVVTPVLTYLQNNFGYTVIYPPLSTLQNPALLTGFIQTTVGNGHHYMCFNKMGRLEDDAVVDPWGNVYGTNNLMVVDDSIAPLNTDGNTGYTAEMIAWRIGKHLLETV